MTRSTRATTSTSTRASRSAEKQRHPHNLDSSKSEETTASSRPIKGSLRTSTQKTQVAKGKQNGKNTDSDEDSTDDEEIPVRRTRGTPQKRGHESQEKQQTKRSRLTRGVRNGISENGVQEDSPNSNKMNGTRSQASSSKEKLKAKSDEPPSKSDEPPSKSDEPPSKSDEPPSKSDETPSKSDEPPSKSVEPPSKSDETPSKSDEPPSKAANKNKSNRKKKLPESDEEDEVASSDDEVILMGVSQSSKSKAWEPDDVEEISTDSEEEDSESDEEDEEEDNDDEIQIMGADDVAAETISKITKKLGHFDNVSNKDVSKLLSAMKKEYENITKIRDEEISRLRNQLKDKDQQLESMNELITQNMELEAKINAILNDPKVYEEEIKNSAEKQLEPSAGQKKREPSAGQKKHEPSAGQKKHEPSAGQKKHEPSAGQKKIPPSVKPQELNDFTIYEDAKKPEVVDADYDSDIEVVEAAPEATPKSQDETSDENVEEDGDDEKDTTKKGKKRRRRSRRKAAAKEDEEEGKKIEALFVSDDEDEDIKEIMSPSKKTRSKKAEDKDEAKNKKAKKDKESGSEEDDGTDDKGRHNIRKLMADKKLKTETKAAAIEEKERLERVAKLKEKHQVVSHIDPKTKQPVYTKMVLAFKKDQKTPLVEVNTKLLKKLKPHQVEAVEFLWDSVIETTKRLKKDQSGSGCIIAHCMGLGKTLSVITFVHTMLTHKALKLKTCLVVCPLNTVLNWQYEWSKWLDKKDRLPTYELASPKDNQARADTLAKWHKNGGIMIMGYQLFRILATSTTKSKKKKKIFEDTLIEQGADIIVCDEGHVLKNDASAISKCMNKIRSKRRIVLTGTPLQNNLVEYHCMVSFVKPNLLGTRREFCNRFVNPITNGQHADSTAFDVKVMKRRAHVLHKMLSGCVQRRDYSALIKFLPPKNEYIVYIRLSPLQIKLYEKYLEQSKSQETPYRGTSLFSDYQALMRIWTHPWVLKMDEIRQEKKITWNDDDDDELGSFLASDSSEEVDETSEDVEDTEAGSSQEDEEEEKEEKKEVEKEVIRGRRSSTRTTRSSSSTADTNKSLGTQNNNIKTENKNKKVVDSDSDVEEVSPEGNPVKGKLIAGEVIKHWQTESRRRGVDELTPEPRKPQAQWWTPMVNEDDHKKTLELSGKLVLLMEILRMAEGLGDKVLLFSQSILSLDLVEDFLSYQDDLAEKAKEKKKGKGSNNLSMWKKDEDYCRMDGSTSAVTRTKFTTYFNCAKNKRMRLFLISTKAGGLGINLDSANRVIIFDASWNPSHDIQSIFRAYRFGQEKDVYIYRFLAQGTMEEKIYDRQVQKETLAQRVIDEHQLDSHFTASDLQDLYKFEPDRLDDPNRKERPTPKVPKDLILAELLSEQKDWVVGYHEHDSLLETRPEENLNEEECKAAWEDYEREKQGFMFQYRQQVPNLPTVSTYNYTYKPNVYMQKYPPGETRPPMLPPGTIVPRRSAQEQARIQDALSALSVAGGGMLPFMAPPTGFSSEQAKLNFQLSQLPRVVQEILKYNPDITPGELQTRLRAFMGMHTRYSNVPGFAMPTQPAVVGQPGVALPTSIVPNTSIANKTVPFDLIKRASEAAKEAFKESFEAPGGQSTPSPAQLSQLITSSIEKATSEAMPSRLPQPGLVPASQR